MPNTNQTATAKQRQARGPFLLSCLFHGAVLLCCLLAIAAPTTTADDDTSAPPNFSLANTYNAAEDAENLSFYWMSEKYDGARALWDGKTLRSRGGGAYAAPAWFVAGLPDTQLDGELWLARGQFEETLSIVRRKTPHEGWRRIRFMVFDLPAHSGTFAQRHAALLSLRAASANPHWQVVQQQKIASPAALQKRYQQILAAGGEGLMLRRIQSRHAGGRSDDLLKMKPYTDAEAIVIGHTPGKGKYQGMVGALRVRALNGTAKGAEFSVGSGLTDAQRQNPPAIGAIITYQHQGLTAQGKPRFPVFLRVRPDLP